MKLNHWAFSFTGRNSMCNVSENFIFQRYTVRCQEAEAEEEVELEVEVEEENRRMQGD